MDIGAGLTGPCLRQQQVPKQRPPPAKWRAANPREAVPQLTSANSSESLCVSSSPPRAAASDPGGGLRSRSTALPAEMLCCVVRCGVGRHVAQGKHHLPTCVIHVLYLKIRQLAAAEQVQGRGPAAVDLPMKATTSATSGPTTGGSAGGTTCGRTPSCTYSMYVSGSCPLCSARPPSASDLRSSKSFQSLSALAVRPTP